MFTEKRFFVAGVQHHDLNTVINAIEEGDGLDLVPEPTNKFDTNAIKIMYEGTMIGYVPKKFSAEVAGAIEIGTDVECEVTKLNKDAKPWEQIEVKIYSLEEFEKSEEEDEEEESDY